MAKKTHIPLPQQPLLGEEDTSDPLDPRTVKELPTHSHVTLSVNDARTFYPVEHKKSYLYLRIEQAMKAMDDAIMAVPTGVIRNELCEANLHLLLAISKLRLEESEVKEEG